MSSENINQVTSQSTDAEQRIAVRDLLAYTIDTLLQKAFPKIVCGTCGRESTIHRVGDTCTNCGNGKYQVFAPTTLTGGSDA